jgi:hypothetical protein
MFDGSMHLNGSSNSHSQEQPKKPAVPGKWHKVP